MARKLTGAIYIMATDLNEYECGAICALASGAVPQKSGQTGHHPQISRAGAVADGGRAGTGQRLRCDTAKTGGRFSLGAPFAFWKIRDLRHTARPARGAAMESTWPPLSSTVPGCHTYLAGRMVAEWRLLARELGIADYAILRKRIKTTRRTYWRTSVRRKFASGTPNRS